MSIHGDMLQEYMSENEALKLEVSRLQAERAQREEAYIRFCKRLCVVLESPGTRGRKGETWEERLSRAVEKCVGLKEGALK